MVDDGDQQIVSIPPVPNETCIRITANQISNGQRKDMEREGKQNSSSTERRNGDYRPAKLDIKPGPEYPLWDR